MTQPDAPQNKNPEVIKGFDTVSDTYDKAPSLRGIAEHLVKVAKLSRGLNVLDIGCGTGWASIPAAHAVTPSGQVIGVDLSKNQLSRAKEKANQVGLKHVEFLEQDASKLDFPDENFDVTICASVIFFLPDAPAALKEWYRVLKPGGRVVFSSFADSSDPIKLKFNERMSLMNPGEKPPASRAKFSRPEDCQGHLSEAGFEQIQISSEQFGHFAASGEEWWEGLMSSYQGYRISALPANQIAQLKADMIHEIELLRTPQGIWRDRMTHFSTGIRPVS